LGVKVDYLICGAGATGLSFLDVILSETDATVAIVDRRDAPGGHWNDAYSFVRLHQSSSFYGVNSRPMNRPRTAADNVDAGTFELASKSEVLQYFHDLMENTY
jgi:cation diffusion facilitator CzcD-associated flavoprotein CzcO